MNESRHLRPECGPLGGRHRRIPVAPAFLIGMLLAAAAPQLPADPASEPAADPADLVAAERAFCRASIARGTRGASLEFLANEAVVFRPGPVNGRQWYLENPPPPGVLTWEPEYEELAASGDLGYTTGPWEYRPDSLGQPPVAFGHYVSIWHRRPPGTFKVVMDFGVTHPKLDPASAPPVPHHEPRVQPPLKSRRGEQADPAEPAAPASVRGGHAILLSADRAYALECAKRGRTGAFAVHSEDGVRVYRAGALPIVGRDRANSSLPDTLKLRAWEPIGGATSHDGQLGFTYGVGQFAPRDWTHSSVDSAVYVRIWRRARDRSWKVILDYAVPLRPARPS